MNLFLRKLMAHPVMGTFVLIMLSTAVISLSTFNILIMFGAKAHKTIGIIAMENWIGTLIGFSWLGYHVMVDLRSQRNG